MNLNPTPKIRLVLYIVTAVGTPLMAYLVAKGFMGELEMALWSAEVTVVSAMAALNVSPDIKK